MKSSLKLLTALMLAATLLLPSCSGDNSADTTDLLSTIPSDASLVVVANTKSMLEKCGCKVSDDQVKADDACKALLTKFDSPSNPIGMRAIFDGDLGVDPSIVAFFQLGYYNYATGFLADPEKFRQAIAKEFNASFSTEEGIDICANVAVSGSRFWININQGSIDPKEVKHFTALDKTQSFLSNDYAEKLSTITTDVEGWGNINGLVNTTGMSFEDRAVFQVATQMLFEDPSALRFSINFEKGEVVMAGGVLNSKGKTARFQLPAGKIDTKTVASIGGTTECLAAIAIPNKLVEKLLKETSAQSPSVLGIYLKLFQGLDGTSAFAFDSKGLIRGIISTNGKDLNSLTNILGENDINVVKEGNILRLSKGDLKGDGDVSEISKDFKDAMVGIAAFNPGDKGNFGKYVASAVITLSPDGDGMKLRLNARSADKNENFLLTILKNQ